MFLGHLNTCPEVVFSSAANAVRTAAEDSGRWIPPRVCEDIAERVLSHLAAHGYTITRAEAAQAEEAG